MTDQDPPIEIVLPAGEVTRSAPWPLDPKKAKAGWWSIAIVAAVALAGGFGIAKLLGNSDDNQPQAPVSSISSTTNPGQTPKPSTTRAQTGDDGNDDGDD